MKRKIVSQRWTPTEHDWFSQVFLQYTSEITAAKTAFRDAPDDPVLSTAAGGAAPPAAFISNEENAWETSHTFKFPACEQQSPHILVERSHRPRPDCCLSCNSDLPRGSAAGRCDACAAAFTTRKCCRCSRQNLTDRDFPSQATTVSPCFHCLRSTACASGVGGGSSASNDDNDADF